MGKSKAKKKANQLKRFKRNEEKIKESGLTQIHNKYRKKVWLCSKCNNIFYAKRSQVVKNPICRNCMTGQSFGEQVAINILTSNNISYEKEKTYSNLKGLGNRKLRFDFYIKKPNLDEFIIEIDGGQHFNSEWSQNTMEHDLIKNQFCLNHNIRLYRIEYVFGKLEKLSNSILSVLKKEGYNVECESTNSYTEVKKKESSAKKGTTKKVATISKYYAVKVGRKNNKIVTSWEQCKKLVNGFSGAKYKSFKTKDEAEKYLNK
ncbi:MAG: viroplasmin family protein [Clostridium sp.]|uniref:ribonuclease H1 domain-containing protein n=1 Tax=Clostridium sp. TaxID=1506 RepID=UPI003EE59678